MPRIFISYRRSDSAAITGRINKELTDIFGADNVFMDVKSIRPGEDFRAKIERELINCDYMLLVIGRGWLSAADANGGRRLDDPTDFVRIEVEIGMRHSNVHLIPVLVDDARMPAADELPATMRDLAYKNAVKVRNEPDFGRDIEQLVNELESDSPSSIATSSSRHAKRRSRWSVGGISLVLLLLLISAITVFFLVSNKLSQTVTSTATPSAMSSEVVAQNSIIVSTATQPTIGPTVSDVPPTTAPETVIPPTWTVSGTDIENTVTAEIGNAVRERYTTRTAEALTQQVNVTIAAFETAVAMTATATMRTPTSTIDVRGTANARLTQTQSIIDASAPPDIWTETSTFTLTPSITATPTATSTTTFALTRTPTPTLTPTASSTMTPSNTLSGEAAAYLTATAQADPFSTCNLSNCNQFWNPVTSVAFGTHQMVFVPAQGSITSFWIDQTEVSIYDYQQCTDPKCNGNPNPNGWNDSGFPAAGITPEQAQDYCQWALGESGGLPSLEQWIYAAGGGPTPSTYSWGELIGNSAEELQPARYDRTSIENGQRLPMRVGIELHHSWVGVTNMSGNIRELVSNGNDYYAVGGHYGSGLAELVIPRPNSSPSLSIGLSDFDQRTGFRCVRAYSAQ